MITRYTKKQSLLDLQSLLSECLEDLNQINKTLTYIPSSHIQIQRYMCVSMAYSQWERFFRQSYGICLKLIQSVYKRNSLCPISLRPIWFRKSPEFQSIVQFINNGRKLEVDQGLRETKSPYEFASKLLEHTLNWVNSDLEHRDIDSLVITLSNVDKKVVEFNAKILGLDQCQEFQHLDLGKLNNLVGHRNDVAHGGLVNSIGERQITDFLEFAESHCNLYYKIIKNWIVKFNTRVTSSKCL